MRFDATIDAPFVLAAPGSGQLPHDDASRALQASLQAVAQVRQLKARHRQHETRRLTRDAERLGEAERFALALALTELDERRALRQQERRHARYRRESDGLT